MTSQQMPVRSQALDGSPLTTVPPGPAPSRAPADGVPARAELARRGSPGSRLLAGEEWQRAERGLHLSGREVEIVRAIFDDRTESAIAQGLGISPHTVHTHVERLYRKLGVTSRTQLVLRVVQSAIGRER